MPDSTALTPKQEQSEPFQPWRTFKPEETKTPHAWVQFKGTDLCADMHCSCGEPGHIDAEFAYFYRCVCGKVYQLSGFLEMREISEAEASQETAIVESDSHFD